MQANSLLQKGLNNLCIKESIADIVHHFKRDTWDLDLFYYIPESSYATQEFAAVLMKKGFKIVHKKDGRLMIRKAKK